MLIPPELFYTATIESFRENRHLPTVDQLLDQRLLNDQFREANSHSPTWFDNEIAAIDLLLKLRTHRDQQATRPRSTTNP